MVDSWYVQVDADDVPGISPEAGCEAAGYGGPGKRRGLQKARTKHDETSTGPTICWTNKVFVRVTCFVRVTLGFVKGLTRG